MSEERTEPLLRRSGFTKCKQLIGKLVDEHAGDAPKQCQLLFKANRSLLTRCLGMSGKCYCLHREGKFQNCLFDRE